MELRCKKTGNDSLFTAGNKYQVMEKIGKGKYLVFDNDGYPRKINLKSDGFRFIVESETIEILDKAILVSFVLFSILLVFLIITLFKS